MSTATQDRSNTQFDVVTNECIDIFLEHKMLDTSRPTFSPTEITGLLFVRVTQIRRIQKEKEEDRKNFLINTFKEVVNYSSLALIVGSSKRIMHMGPETKMRLHKSNILQARALFQNKNHDYGEAWRDLRISSMTDLILMKLFRIRQIEGNQGITIISEGIDANYLDILNYAVFCLILISEGHDPMD